MHRLAVALIVAKTIDFTAGLREQRSLAQLFVQILAMEQAARFGPADVIAVFADLEFASLFTQGRHVLDQKTEGRILIAALLGEVVVGQQALPQALANPVDRLHVDRAQPQALGQRRFVQGFTGQQHAGEHEDFRARGDIEQRRVTELFRPGAAIERGHVPRCRHGTEAQKPGR
ncbi:hypothetical protein D3C84_826360 [compost metagenome]